eukprot:GHVR01028731.1.p2 GENE.GHVR01028731.1~~GHVR01028731.1.p2  ORF type:complete len:172 (-),score=51.78 GHVR01028731.1:193-708(-)
MIKNDIDKWTHTAFDLLDGDPDSSLKNKNKSSTSVGVYETLGSSPTETDGGPHTHTSFLHNLLLAAGGDFNDFTDHHSGPPPASRDCRFALPMKTVAETDVKCSVCQCDLTVRGKAKVMPCGHYFHQECIIEWLERHNTCPTCRSELPSEKHDYDISAEKVQKKAPPHLYS